MIPKSHRNLKIILLIVGTILVLVLVLWPHVEALQEDISTLPAPLSFKKIQSKEIINPRFVSTDPQKRPYSIQAQRAIPISADQILLENITACLTLEDGTLLSMTAQNADMKPGKTGILKGGVTLIHEGHELFSPSAHVDFEKGLISGTEFVEGYTNYGQFKGDQGFTIDRKNISVKGPVHVILYQNPSPTPYRENIL